MPGFLASLTLLLALAFPAAAERLIPLGDVDRTALDGLIAARAAQSQLVSEILGPELFPERRDGLGDRDGVLRIMALRLGFRTNRHPEWTTVPVDGKFMAASDTIPVWRKRIDPPPHDRAYFEAHMLALTEYYRIQSYGKAQLEWDVLPAGDDIFLLPDIADFGPMEVDSVEAWTVKLLEAFTRTALDSIDAALQAIPDGPRFADYDAVLLFHAGSDWQNDIWRDSPNDLPSFNIFFGDSLGPHMVDGGQTPLESVLILPETSIQDVNDGDPLGALNAVLAHEIAHQFGLMDIYDTYSFWPVVGYWDLMDSGHQIVARLQKAEADSLVEFSVYGCLPTSLGIWHKMLTGWVGEADGSLVRMGGGDEDFQLWASGLQSPGMKALRVDLSDMEYFLLENRQELLTTASHYIEQDDATGVILYVADWDTEENTGEYDMFIPQSGLLAWHIDERDMDYLFPNNTLNMYGDWHVWLVEASGINNLGNPYSWDWRGTEYDPFYTGNNTYWAGETAPDTRLKDGTASGFSLSHLVTSPYLVEEDAFDPTINFTVSLAGAAPGYPMDDGPFFEGKLDYQPAANTLMPYEGGGLAYWMAALEPDSTTRAYAVVAGRDAEDPVQEPLLSVSGYPLSSARLDNFFGGKDHWFLFTADSLFAFTIGEEGLAPAELAGLPLFLESPLLAGPATGPGFMTWLDAAGRLNLLSGAKGLRSIVPEREEEPPAAWSPPILFSGPDGLRIAAQMNDQIWFLRPEGGQELPEAFDLPEGQLGHAWLRSLDIDGDGADEIFRIGRDGRVDGWSLPAGWDGMPGGETRVASWQAPLDGDSLVTGPAVGDMDGDGRPELFLATATKVFRFTPDGGLFANWPLRPAELAYLDPPMQVAGSLILADMTGDGLSELCLFAQTGHVLVVDDQARPTIGTPRSLAGEAPLDIWADEGRLRAVSWQGYRLGLDGAAGSGAAEWSLAGGGPGRGGRWARVQAFDPQDEVLGDEADWLIYPNPAAGRVCLHHPAMAIGVKVKAELYDLEGQQRLAAERTSHGGPFQLELDLAGLASGVYLLRFEAVDGERGIEGVRRLAVIR